MTNPPIPEGVSRRGFLKSAGACPALALAPAAAAQDKKGGKPQVKPSYQFWRSVPPVRPT